MVNFINDVSHGLRTLLYPPICISCLNLCERYLCQNCRSEWSTGATCITRSPLVMVASRSYDDSAQRVLLSAKEDGNRAARDLIAISITYSILQLLSQIQIMRANCDSITLVPMPSRKKNIRRRGEKFLIPILERVHIELAKRQRNVRFEVKEILIHSRSVKEQSGLTFQERRRNMDGALRINGAVLRKWRETPVILIDDVITTGSSMASAYKTLMQAKITVLGGVSACATSARMPIR